MSEASGPKLKQKYLLKVQKVIDHTKLIRELYLECVEPNEFKFRAGQFVMLHVPTADKPTLRAYSIASDERKFNSFRLIFKFVENGVASQYVWNLKQNETLTFTGPFGRVFFKEPPTEQIVMLNTGSGIAQHLSYLESSVEKYNQLNFKMLIGLRHPEDIYYSDELKKLKNKLQNFDFKYVLSRPNSTWTGLKGYVQEHLNQFDLINIPSTIYLCGNGSMIKDTKALLTEMNFAKEKIFAEAFD